MDDLVGWIQGLFADCSARAPFGIGWDLDRAAPPLTASVTPADRSTGRIVLRRDDVGERIQFAARLQAFLDVELDRPVPPCPSHRVGLIPSRDGDEVEWRCPEGDFRACVGDYLQALWPPGPDEEPGRLGPMLSARFRRRGVTGVHSFGVERRGGCWVATVKLGPEGAEVAVRDAAAPIVVEFASERAEAVRAVRVQRPATATEPAHEALSLNGAAIPLAALGGRLRRAGADEDCDFCVDDARVR